MRLNKTLSVLAVVPIALLGSQALAENWVTLGSMGQGTSFSIDKDSIQRASDGLVHYTDNNSLLGKSDKAADCQQRMSYVVGDNGEVYAKWRDHGRAVEPGSIGEIELQYACANAGLHDRKK